MAWVIDSYKPREMTKAEKNDFDLCNERIVDTAGFVPLHVRMQRMIEQGIIAQFTVNEFDSTENRDLYLGEDTTITPDMDFEDIQQVLVRRELLRRDFLSRKQSEEMSMNEQPVGEKEVKVIDEKSKAE